MENHKWITATIGIVLALGMTRLINSGVAIFRSRNRATLHWVPIVWAFCIFFSMIDLSWDLHNSTSEAMSPWGLTRGLILFGFSLILFFAGALILPLEGLLGGGSLKDEFAKDGRWALTFLAAYDFLCIVYNWLQWHVSPITLVGALNALLAMLALIALKTTSPKTEGTVTVLYAALLLIFACFSF